MRAFCIRCHGQIGFMNKSQVCADCYNAGDWYDDQVRLQDEIRTKLEAAFAAKNVDLIKKLTRELERALYVGD